MQKEVNRLRGLVSAGPDNTETDGLSACPTGSPCSFKWDGGHGSFSPLTFDKRLSQVGISYVEHVIELCCFSL